MGTKDNPGQFDCYAKALPNEPMFVLLGRDPYAASLVEAWALSREAVDGSTDKIVEARRCALAMEQWCKEKRPVLTNIQDFDAFQEGYQRGRSDGAAELRKKYDELIYAVATKYPGESRHQTALRYICKAEERNGGTVKASCAQDRSERDAQSD